MSAIEVHKGRTTTITIGLGFDVSGDVITSQIRTRPETTSELIAEWAVSFVNDGTDGELLLVLDNSITDTITQSEGFMDLKRVSGGEPLSVFDDPIGVIFKGTVTQ